MTSLARLVVTALALVLLTSCGGGTSKDKAASSASSSASTSASASASASSSTSSGPSATGPTITGTGYTYHLPDGWQDISTQLKSSQPGIDSGGRASPATPPFTANLNTVTQPSSFQGKPTTKDLAALAAQLKQEVATLAPSLKSFPTATIDGAPAIHQEGVAQQGSSKFYLVQYMAVRGSSVYGLTFALPEADTQAQRDQIVQPVLSSFQFQ